MLQAQNQRVSIIKRSQFGHFGRALALLAAAFMCFAGLHNAAHDYHATAQVDQSDKQHHDHHGHAHHHHDHHAHHREAHNDNQDDNPIECLAFHLVAALAAAPAPDIAVNIALPTFVAQRVLPRTNLIRTLPIAQRPLPRGPPTHSI